MTPLLCLILVVPAADDVPSPMGVHPGSVVAATPKDAFVPPGAVQYEPQVGDIVLFKNINLIQNVAYALLLSGGMTHVGIIVARPDGSLALLEAPGIGYPVMFSDPLSRIYSYGGPGYVRRRHKPLTAEQSAKLTAFACAQEHKPFDTKGLFGPPCGRPIRMDEGQRSELDCLDQEKWFCSSLVVLSGVAAGLIDPLKVQAKYTSPQDLATDKQMDLSRCWGPPEKIERCKSPTKGWWSRSTSGECQFWK